MLAGHFVGCLVCWLAGRELGVCCLLDSFNAELSPERYWWVRRSQRLRSKHGA